MKRLPVTYATELQYKCLIRPPSYLHEHLPHLLLHYFMYVRNTLAYLPVYDLHSSQDFSISRFKGYRAGNCVLVCLYLAILDIAVC